jgi:hypothetical protein
LFSLAIDLCGQTDFTAERNGVELGHKFVNPSGNPCGTSFVASLARSKMVSNRVFRDVRVPLWPLPFSLVRTLHPRWERSAICTVVYVDCDYCLSDDCVDLHCFPPSPKEVSFQKRKPREFWQIDRMAKGSFTQVRSRPFGMVTFHTLSTKSVVAG